MWNGVLDWLCVQGRAQDAKEENQPVVFSYIWQVKRGREKLQLNFTGEKPLGIRMLNRHGIIFNYEMLSKFCKIKIF